MKRLIPIFLLLAVIISIVLYGHNQTSGLCVEYYYDSRIGVADLVNKEYNQQDFSFLCSAVFTLENDNSGNKKILDVTSQFVQRYKGSGEFTFSRIGEPETICQEEGHQYVIQQSFQASHMGYPIGNFQVAAQFTYIPETGKFIVAEL